MPPECTVHLEGNVRRERVGWGPAESFAESTSFTFLSSGCEELIPTSLEFVRILNSFQCTVVKILLLR